MTNELSPTQQTESIIMRNKIKKNMRNKISLELWIVLIGLSLVLLIVLIGLSLVLLIILIGLSLVLLIVLIG